MKTFVMHIFVIFFLCFFPVFALSLSDVAGGYEVVVDTPIGKKNGNVVVMLDGIRGFKGSISLFGYDNDFDGGVFDGLNFSFSGKMCVGLLKISYTASGTFDGGVINADADTKFGNMKIVGKKVN